MMYHKTMQEMMEGGAAALQLEYSQWLRNFKWLL